MTTNRKQSATEKESGELKVFISHRDSVCDECGDELGRQAWVFLARERGAICLECADLDHLAYLPSGDAAVTRRAKRYSRLSAVVLRFSRARRRYERQGLLVEEQALAKAEEECLADADVRERRRQREAVRREELDEVYVGQFAEQIRLLFPGCPTGREQLIAEHACRKYSGRVGRSAAARTFNETAMRLAVAAHIRHCETNYDELLGRGRDRGDARQEVQEVLERVLVAWKGSP